ncbi:dynamin family protein [Paenibacillus thermotolerans]|uniref:dynamin family protein n=1 Tax=Paenibacillus thermotolerans TaxID=3027807 RepID=UPI002368A92A|nr:MULTISPECIES: dynamin family protein [unclassified Paenibacillus]
MNNRESLLRELEELNKALLSAGDTATAEKARALADKVREGTFYMALCGHFSAGKSSLINRICRAELLPSSPIPTSANVVSIHNGPSEAVIVYRDGTSAHIPIVEVPKYAKNGQEVESVELRHPISFLGDHAALLDTPGVDSTDDAHQMATESALHLADLVIYVMDYNHVLSEMNMEFAKRLTDLGKPLVLVVNQIDKHREAEVPFGAFRDGVTDAFAAWGVHPAAAFYTTLKAPEHPHNELGLLRSWLRATVLRGEQLGLRGAASAALRLTEEHAAYVASLNEERKAELRELAATDEAQTFASRFEELSRELNRRTQLRHNAVELVRAEAAKIAQNANLTPAATRDLAHAFLESRQSGFKVGLLFTAAKTEEERKRRLEAFHADFREQVTAQLVWHVRSLLKRTAEELGLAGDEAAQRLIEGVDAEVTPEWLLGMVRPGAVLSGEYTLNFAKEIAEAVRQSVRKAATAAAEALVEAAAAAHAAEEDQLRAELAQLNAQLAHVRELEKLEAAERASAQALAASLSAAANLVREPAQFPDPSLLQAEPEEETAAPHDGMRRATAGVPPLAAVTAEAERGGAAAQEPDASPQDGTRSFRGRLQAAANALDDAAGVVDTIAPLAASARTLRDKARRMRDQRFTAALFGAFSAGKSSFANALLGEDALPVSPNPTTASINTVVPPNDEWPHGIARVFLKPRASVLEDIAHSLRTLGFEPAEGESIVPFLRKTMGKTHGELSDNIPPGGKPHVAFLRAVTDGWDEAEPFLGTELRADRDTFRAYVAEEKKSAFVDKIELYYESPLSKQGVTLVDTPGADSINARHTGVAFNYIKNADAIFFVTYYNHAFSRADRQFLEQLGRVKDAMELDKMFFIVNAADLASSAEELQDVLNHVRDNLTAFGIRNPRLFPVSSLQALEAKRNQSPDQLAHSGMAAFEQAFGRFAGEELAALAFRSAEGELRRTLSLLHSLIEAARTGEEERSAALAKLSADEQAAIDRVRAESVQPELQAAAKEIAEQFYYIKQRVMFRFGEWYGASFNPSSLREDKGDSKESLAWAWRDLSDYIGKELENETLAVTVRMERFINGALERTFERWTADIRKRIPSFDPGSWEPYTFATPSSAFKWSAEEADMKLLKQHYKSAKHFFEGAGRKELKEALERRWQEPIAAALEEARRSFEEWYAEAVQTALGDCKEKAETLVTEAAGGIRTALSEVWNLPDLEARDRQLSDIFTAFEEMA